MSDVVTDTHALIWYLEDSPFSNIKLDIIFNRVFYSEWYYEQAITTIIKSLS